MTEDELAVVKIRRYDGGKCGLAACDWYDLDRGVCEAFSGTLLPKRFEDGVYLERVPECLDT